MTFFLKQHDEIVFVIPTVSVVSRFCKCCDQPCGTHIGLSWGVWTMGIIFHSKPCQ